MNTEENILNDLKLFEDILNIIPVYPDLKQVPNDKLLEYLLDIQKSEEYDIKLTNTYDDWVESVLNECLIRGIAEIKTE